MVTAHLTAMLEFSVIMTLHFNTLGVSFEAWNFEVMPVSLGSASHRKSASAKRLIVLGLAVTLGFSAIFAVILWDMARRDRSKALDGAANLVATIASDISRNIQLYESSLEAVIEGLKLPDIDKIDPELRRLVLFDRAATAKDLGAILVFDKDGNIVIDSRSGEPVATNHAHRDFFQIHKERADVGLYISRPWISLRGKYLISLSRRLSNPDGSFAGVVAGTMRLSYFHDQFRKVNLAENDTLTLISAGGVVLMRSPFKIESIGIDIGNSFVWKKFPAAESGSYETASAIDGIKRVYTFQRIGEYPLLVINGLSLRTIYAGWWQEALLIGSLILALCAVNIVLIVSLARELRRRTEAEHELAVIATTDSLTGLYNRRRLDEVVASEWLRARRVNSPVAMLMIDVDCFKAYNDKYGHQAGDRALAAVAECIAMSANRPADLCARYGGEEFAVLLPGETVEGAFEIAERVRGNVLSLRASQHQDPEMVPTVSVGVASMVPDGGLTLCDLIKAADGALYEAKRNGRNRTEVAMPLRWVETERELISVSA
jgi:diguanylate cyclase (GGDEF)-like protein